MSIAKSRQTDTQSDVREGEESSHARPTSVAPDRTDIPCQNMRERNSVGVPSELE